MPALPFWKYKFTQIIGKINRPAYIAALGLLSVVLLLWAPFGLKTTDVVEGWGNLYLAEHSDTTLRMGGSRPLLYMPWELASSISRDSFLGARIVFAAFFFGKALVLYHLLRKMRVAAPSLAFLIALLFILYPADQGNFTMRALGRQSGVFFYFLSVLLMALACQKPNPLFIVGMLAAEAASAMTAEQGFLLMLATPLALLLCDDCSKSKKGWIALLWYVILALCIINFVQAGRSYQTGLIERGMRSDIFQYLKEIIWSNLLAYRRIFVDGWLKAIGSLKDIQSLYLPYAAAITLVAGGATWWIARATHEQDRQVITSRHFIALVFTGLAIIGLSFFPYSITVARYDNVRVFYYAAAGGALITGIIYFRIIQALPRFGKAIEIILWGATVFIIAFNGLKQHAGFVAQSQAQQQILINILEQAPYLKPEAAIVLLVDDASNSPFESSVIFRAALKWTYNKQKIEALQCSEKTGNCKFGAQGIEGLAAAASAQKSLVPYENALLFSYSTGKGATLMEQIPPKYQPEGITFIYQPYRHILAYAPFPSRPEKAFDFAPDPVRLSPATWIGNEQTLNDRKVCTVSHSGQCSLQFWGDGDPARFEQEIKMSGNAGERLELSFWGKSQDVAEGKIPTAKITLFYGDGSEDEFIVPGQFSADWSLQEFIFETSKPYTRFLITLFPNPQPGVIWLDDLRLIKDNLEIGIENPSFEK